MDQVKTLFSQSIEQQQRDLSGMEKIRLRLKMSEIAQRNLSPKQTLSHLSSARFSVDSAETKNQMVSNSS